MISDAMLVVAGFQMSTEGFSRLPMRSDRLGETTDMSKRHNVATRLGPRFYDWQLAQTAEESWRECELHARNLAGGSPSAQKVDSEPQPAATKPSLPLFGRPTD